MSTGEYLCQLNNAYQFFYDMVNGIAAYTVVLTVLSLYELPQKQPSN